MRRAWLTLLLLLPVFSLLTGCPPPATPDTAPILPNKTTPASTAPSGEVRVFIPCGMIVPMNAVATAFMKLHPDIKIQGIYDNAGIIVKRILEKGEKADLVVSPGSTEMNALQAAKAINPAEQKAIGDFDLVVIVPTANKLGIKTPADLKRAKTIAMPDPDVNSVGTSGREALTKLGLYDTLKSRMFLPKHAIEAHTMVAAGKADAGISYKNCPLDTNPAKLSKSKVAVAFAFPKDSYVKQQCLVAPLTAATNTAAAKLYLDYLTSTDGLKLLAANGMTGCLSLACPAPTKTSETTKGKPEAPAAKVDTSKALVKVIAFYPDTEGHAKIKQLVNGLNQKYGGKVAAEFVNIGSDEGFKRWHDDAGMSCGGILIDDQQTWTYEKSGKPVEVTFKQQVGGEWTADDLYAVISKALKAKQQ